MFSTTADAAKTSPRLPQAGAAGQSEAEWPERKAQGGRRPGSPKAELDQHGSLSKRPHLPVPLTVT